MVAYNPIKCDLLPSIYLFFCLFLFFTSSSCLLLLFLKIYNFTCFFKFSFPQNNATASLRWLIFSAKHFFFCFFSPSLHVLYSFFDVVFVIFHTNVSSKIGSIRSICFTYMIIPFLLNLITVLNKVLFCLKCACANGKWY